MVDRPVHTRMHTPWLHTFLFLHRDCSVLDALMSSEMGCMINSVIVHTQLKQNYALSLFSMQQPISVLVNDQEESFHWFNFADHTWGTMVHGDCYITLIVKISFEKQILTLTFPFNMLIGHQKKIMPFTFS